jgi:hypothetical protein
VSTLIGTATAWKRAESAVEPKALTEAPPNASLISAEPARTERGAVGSSLFASLTPDALTI